MLYRLLIRVNFNLHFSESEISSSLFEKSPEFKKSARRNYKTRNEEKDRVITVTLKDD